MALLRSFAYENLQSTRILNKLFLRTRDGPYRVSIDLSSCSGKLGRVVVHICWMESMWKGFKDLVNLGMQVFGPPRKLEPKQYKHTNRKAITHQIRHSKFGSCECLVTTYRPQSVKKKRIHWKELQFLMFCRLWLRLTRIEFTTILESSLWSDEVVFPRIFKRL